MNDDTFFAASLAKIRVRFLHMLREQLTEIDKLCDPCITKLSPLIALAQVQMILHKIAGTAGTLGLVDLGEKARAGEGIIISFLATGEPGEQQLYRTLAEFVVLAKDTLANTEAATGVQNTVVASAIR